MLPKFRLQQMMLCIWLKKKNLSRVSGLMEDSLTLKEQKLYCEQTLFQEQTEGGIWQNVV